MLHADQPVLPSLTEVETPANQLFKAAVAGADAETIRRIVEETRIDVNTIGESSQGYTALHAVCIHAPLGASSTARELLRLGADPNAKANEDLTPLFMAIGSNSFHLVSFLVENGANPFAKR